LADVGLRAAAALRSAALVGPVRRAPAHT
jgi:hypothetical protein